MKNKNKKIKKKIMKKVSHECASAVQSAAAVLIQNFEIFFTAVVVVLYTEED